MGMRNLWIPLLLFTLAGCSPRPASEPYVSEPVSQSELSLPPSTDADIDGNGRDDPETEVQESNVETGYYNPGTGYRSSYDLDVEYGSGGKVERIEFPNGGREDDFVDQRDNGDGTTTVTDEGGREFTVESSD